RDRPDQRLLAVDRRERRRPQREARARRERGPKRKSGDEKTRDHRRTRVLSRTRVRVKRLREPDPDPDVEGRDQHHDDHERNREIAEKSCHALAAATISAAPSTIRSSRGTTSRTLSRAHHAMSSSRPGGPYVRAVRPVHG